MKKVSVEVSVYDSGKIRVLAKYEEGGVVFGNLNEIFMRQEQERAAQAAIEALKSYLSVCNIVPAGEPA